MVKTLTRAALYLHGISSEADARDLRKTASMRRWLVVAVYDDGSGSRAQIRVQRAAMLEAAVRGEFDVAMVWSVSRLAVSLPDLVRVMQELRGAGRDLLILREEFDTTTENGRAMFASLDALASLERCLTRTGIVEGLERARAAGVKFGRRPVSSAVEDAIRARLAEGVGMLRVARELGVGTGTVQRVRAAMG